MFRTVKRWAEPSGRALNRPPRMETHRQALSLISGNELCYV